MSQPGLGAEFPVRTVAGVPLPDLEDPWREGGGQLIVSPFQMDPLLRLPTLVCLFLPLFFSPWHFLFTLLSQQDFYHWEKTNPEFRTNKGVS